VTATITLPPGVDLTGTAVRSGSGFGLGAVLAEPFVVSGDWLCLGSGSTVTCTGPDVAADGTSSVYLGVRAAADAAGSTPVKVTVSAQNLDPVTVTGSTGVAASGISARWAGRGHLAVTEVGAPLLSCPTATKGCADARADRGETLNNDSWQMARVDTDGDPTTVDSSSTVLNFKPGSEVVFAGLYWSGNTPKDTSEATLGSARLTDPMGTQTDITADRVDHATTSQGAVYQAFADVTDQVNKVGAGSWTLGGVAVDPGAGHYGGWSLVVVYGDSARPVGKVTVFEGFQVVQQRGSVSFTVAGTAGMAARIGLVAWEGDAGLSGDRMHLDGVDLTPTSGRKDANNVADSTATGAADANSFGVDAKALAGATFSSDRASLVASTTQDVFLVGVVTVSATG
jgi:hypothetical protein